jgi:hypothetical protein
VVILDSPALEEQYLSQDIFAAEIGMVARDFLSQPRPARVMGKTSRGIFLHLPPEQLSFLSLETFRGPLTVNLTIQSPGAYTESLERIQIGSSVKVIPGQLHFPEAAVTIFTSQALRWQTPEPALAAALPYAQRQGSLSAVSGRLLALRSPGLLGGLLPSILSSADFFDLSQTSPGSLLARLGQTLRAGQLADLTEALDPLLGLGGGLTPSGDDLTCGFLLALNRWGDVLAPGIPRSELNQSIRSLAYRKTTLLSANLIDCASQGHGDERLLQALDGIMTGAPEADACASLLAQWGNTSGLDALVGMALAINAPDPGG